MPRTSFHIVAVAAALAFFAGPAKSQSADDGVVFRIETLGIETPHGTYPFQVEMAESMSQRAHGLMFRRELAPDHGMLFLYPREETIMMWMKNTYIPLDMLFIGRDGRISRIAAETKPMSTDVIASGPAAKAVLELAGGTVSRLGIKEGDRIVDPHFEAPASAP